MFGTFRTLIAGASARSEEQARDHFAIELIDQKIREATASLKAAKLALAGLIQRQRAETRQSETLKTRIDDLMSRAKEALDKGRDDLASQAAQAVADLENELEMRAQTLQRFDTRILQLRQSVEAAHRRLIDLKQGAVSARAMRREQGAQRRLLTQAKGTASFDEAEELIARVLQEDDPFEQTEILREIDGGLGHADLETRMSDAGIGARTKSTADQVMNRLKS